MFLSIGGNLLWLGEGIARERIEYTVPWYEMPDAMESKIAEIVTYLNERYELIEWHETQLLRSAKWRCLCPTRSHYIHMSVLSV